MITLKDAIDAHMNGDREQATVLVDPESAEYALSLTRGNRRIRTPGVLAISKDMKDGRWDTRVAPRIIIGRDGTVIDGQHRLSAVIESGIPTPMDVVIDATLTSALGLPLDAHSKRTPSDILLIKPKEAEVIRVFAWVASTGKVTRPHDLVKWLDLVGDDVAHLLSVAPSTRRGVSTAGVKMAFVLWNIENPVTRDRMSSLYKAMVTGDVLGLTTLSSASLYKQLSDGDVFTATGGSQRSLEEACRVTAALSNPDSTRIVVRNLSAAMSDLRARVRALDPDLDNMA